MSKAYYYVTNDDKNFVRLRNVSMKEVHVGLQITITWTNKFGKGGQNVNIFVLKVGSDIKIFKNSWRLNSLARSLCLKKLLN